MKFRNVTLYLAAICVTIPLLFGVRAVQSNLDRQIAEHHLRYAGNIKNAPPLVVITTVALGSFRGIIADLLWLRAESLKNKHSYYELVQLAQWITDLQPNNSSATCFLAWNMAYNISVTCSSPIERWRWVNDGINLLRYKAIEYNPDDPAIYKELAWIFAHKLGNVMDDANVYYKNRLAVEMQNIFGRFPDWEKMAAAPTDRDAFLKEHPETHPLWRSIPGGDLDEKYDFLYGAFKKSAPELPPEVKSAGENVLHYLRAELLREICRLDSRKILEINRKYGTLDWRTPEAQAIYWTLESIAHSVENSGEREINTDRIVNNALYQSFLAGRVMNTDPDLGKWSNIDFVLYPNLSLADAVYKIYTDSQKYHDSEDLKSSSFRTARNNFLKEAVYVLSAFGAFSKAEEYYKLLVEDDGPQKFWVGDREVVFTNLEDFAKAAWIDHIKNANAKQAQVFISGLIYCCLVNEAIDNHDQAVFYERSARYVYDYYVNRIGTNARMEIPPYNELKKLVQTWCLEVLPPDQVRRLKSIIANEQAEIRAQQRMRDQAQPQTPPPAAGK
jgi:hypothetical protein